MTKIKPSLPLGRLPVLEVRHNTDSEGRPLESDDTGGAVIAQSASIERYLARELGLIGDTVNDAALCDMWYETFKELIKGTHSRWGKVFKIEDLRAGLEEPKHKSYAGAVGQKFRDVPTFKDSTNGGEYTAFERSYFAIRTFEDQLRETAMGTIAGTKDFSYVDLAMFLVLLDLNRDLPGWFTVLELPNLGSLFLKILATNPNVVLYLESNRRMPRIEVKTEPKRDYHFIKDAEWNSTEALKLFPTEWTAGTDHDDPAVSGGMAHLHLVPGYDTELGRSVPDLNFPYNLAREKDQESYNTNAHARQEL